MLQQEYDFDQYFLRYPPIGEGDVDYL